MLSIGIAGGTGSGKTTLANALCGQLGTDISVLIPHDCYYKHLPHIPFEQRSCLNYDHPDAFETDLLVTHLSQLREHLPIELPAYDFTTHLRKQHTTTTKASSDRGAS